MGAYIAILNLPRLYGDAKNHNVAGLPDTAVGTAALDSRVGSNRAHPGRYPSLHSRFLVFRATGCYALQLKPCGCPKRSGHAKETAFIAPNVMKKNTGRYRAGNKNVRQERINCNRVEPTPKHSCQNGRWFSSARGSQSGGVKNTKWIGTNVRRRGTIRGTRCLRTTMNERVPRSFRRWVELA